MEISDIEPELAFQKFFKAINNSVGFNGLVIILLVFDIYPRITEHNAPSPSIIQHIMTMQKAINKV